MRIVMLVALAALLVAGPAGAQEQRPYGDVQLFTRVGQPGQPEGIVVDDDGRVYVSTNSRGKGGEGPSKIFRYTAEGQLDRTYVAQGQDPDVNGLLGMAFDAQGRLYVMDYDPARVLRFDPASGRQETYATIPDIPLCAEGVEGACEPSLQESTPWPNWPVFDADGNLYVTDLQQATIWRIAPGGGVPEPWHQHPDYASIFSLNGQQFDADGNLLFVLTGSFQPSSPARGAVYRLEVGPDGHPGERTLLYETLPAEGPDGLAIGASGRIYVALVTANQVLVLEPDGTEFTRFPDPVSNRTEEVPFDSPASIAFRGTSIMVTNHAFFSENPDSWAVLDVEVHETGLPLHYPVIPSAPGATTDAPTPSPTAPPVDPGGPAGPALPATGAGATAVLLGILALGAARLTHGRQ